MKVSLKWQAICVVSFVHYAQHHLAITGPSVSPPGDWLPLHLHDRESSLSSFWQVEAKEVAHSKIFHRQKVGHQGWHSGGSAEEEGAHLLCQDCVRPGISATAILWWG